MKTLTTIILILLLVFNQNAVNANDGYGLWLNYYPVSESLQAAYKNQIQGLQVIGNNSTMDIVKTELSNGLNSILSEQISSNGNNQSDKLVIAAKLSDLPVKNKKIENQLKNAGDEGFLIYSKKVAGKKSIIITANSDFGVLYGAFHFLRMIQTGKDIKNLNLLSSPKVMLRVLNHWDNPDGSIERGYAGQSLWDWESLPDKADPRYVDYARANASIGINGSVLNNVNADPKIITEEYLRKVAVIADIFRPYGLKVYLSIKFSSPVNIGGMETADPLDPEVQQWWKNKVDEIHSIIPDFGGFLVKANSEGQPGPQNYGRNHAEGANMLAEALKPHGGIVMWRAFVYDNEVPIDRAMQSQNEFKPLDGQFLDNVLIQSKNGAIDFQPREPFHPLFGAIPNTQLMMEFQITQEYLGHSTDLCYLAPMYKEVLEADTYAKGKGSTVAKVIDGTLENHKLTGMAGVANTGSDRNWTGHLFGQSNWFAFGNLAWNHELTSEEIADDWIKMTFSSSDQEVVSTIKKIMMESHENSVNYMTPLGLHHIMGNSFHLGPGPWVSRGRADWTSVYYHRADSAGVGFDRTPTGSDATSQYFKPVADKFANLKTCPDEFLLWFHHLPWDYKMRSGKTLWDEMVTRYYTGVEAVKEMQQEWDSLDGKINNEVFQHVKGRIEVQVKLAEWWRDACVLYFQQFSNMPIPDGFEKPKESLDYYMQLHYRDFQAKN
ncbi:MAG: alpha-glucuronidase [Prolixibacteraceae bacterium]|nr:alpha-glucuronidase [Prolixibacteraceae bacterium]